MYLNQLSSIENSINRVKNKLKAHQELGVKSTLSVFEVAQLMDSLKMNSDCNENNSNSSFVNFSIN